MWNLKHLDELKKVIDDFVVPRFGCKTSLDTDFSYYPSEEIITWSVFMANKSDKYFKQFVEQRFPNITADIFLWSIFHEIGHHVTYDEWDNDEFDKNEKIKDVANNLLDKKPLSDDEERLAYFMYFSAPDEKRATDWAAHYMETHAESVEKFWGNFTKEFDVFLVENMVEKD